MTVPKAIAVTSQNALLRAQIMAAMQRYFPDIEITAAAPVAFDLDAAAKPQRLGKIIDDIATSLRPSARENIACGPYQLAVADCLLYRPPPDDAPIRLTEKERDILVRLLAANGAWVSRPQLLTDLWGYGPGIETHTLETHIYRLRQKFEPDPGAPQWLLSKEAGYRLAI